MITKFLQECDGIKVAKTANRSVLASMTDLVFRSKYYLETEDDTVGAACKINMVPMGFLKYKYPLEVFALAWLEKGAAGNQ